MYNLSSLLNITLPDSDGLSVHHQESWDCTHSIRYMSYMFVDYLLAGTRWSSISCPLVNSQRTCMTYTWCCVYSLRTPDDGRKDRPNQAEWCSINSKNCASSWFYYRNISRCTVAWTSNLKLLNLCFKVFSIRYTILIGLWGLTINYESKVACNFY